jgi:hypothetical protein
MTSADIPERLEWRCMLPVRFLGWKDPRLNVMECAVSYNSTGLEVVKEIIPDGIKAHASNLAIEEWFDDETESHFVEFLGGLHGRGRFFGHDRKTGEVRSLWHDIWQLGFAVEDDE